MFNSMKNVSTPSNWPIKNSGVFQFEQYDEKGKREVYQLDHSKLAKKECHMFFPIKFFEEALIATSLEYVHFHPANANLNEKFNMYPVRCGTMQLFHCSFPREFKETCQNTAKIFGMTMNTKSKTIQAFDGIDRQTIIHFPQADNVLYFEGNRSDDLDKFEKDHENIVWVGNRLQQYGIE